MSNISDLAELPPLPSYTLRPLPPLISPIPDKYLTLLLPIVAYWVLSMVFHYVDTYDLFPQYRLHTPAEVLKRNHVSRWEVVRDVAIQQVVQTFMGTLVALTEPTAAYGKDDYNVAVWAQRIRLAQRAVPTVLAFGGIDAQALAQRAYLHNPSLSGFVSGGQYAWLTQVVQDAPVPVFASWEMVAAKAIYWVAIPALQFLLAMLIVDTWQYFLHRAMHMNKWLYTTFHSRHHRLYVPYAYGALYNHPLEGLLLDTLGAGIAYLVTGLTPRQSMWFFTGSIIKTVDDHCGYALPWDPLQLITTNNAGYHDVHHQSWGIKTNFSQPFFTFWDRLLGTVWTGGDVSARYERARLAAQRKIDHDGGKSSEYASTITGSRPLDSITEQDGPYAAELASTKKPSSSILSTSLPTIPDGKAAQQAAGSRAQVLSDPHYGGAGILAEETAEEKKETKRLLRRNPRNISSSTTSSSSAQSGGLKGLRDRVSGHASFHGPTAGMLGYESGI